MLDCRLTKLPKNTTLSEWEEAHPVKVVQEIKSPRGGPFEGRYAAEHVKDFHEVFDEVAYQVVKFKDKYYVVGVD